jgi:hypothetical protein
VHVNATGGNFGVIVTVQFRVYLLGSGLSNVRRIEVKTFARRLRGAHAGSVLTPSNPDAEACRVLRQRIDEMAGEVAAVGGAEAGRIERLRNQAITHAQRVGC